MLESKCKSLTTPQTIYGRTSNTEVSTTISIPDLAILYVAKPGLMSRNCFIVRATPSTLNRSGLFGKNSTSILSDSIRSTSAHSNGSRSFIRSMLTPVRFSKSALYNFITGMSLHQGLYIILYLVLSSFFVPFFASSNILLVPSAIFFILDSSSCTFKPPPVR